MKYNNFLILAIFLVFFVVIFTQKCDNVNQGEYTFHDLDGQVINLEKYKGKYSILTFTFTRCPSICPMINYELNKLRFKYQDKINILSINVDPENDTPGSLKRFMESNQFDWDILIGDKKQINNLIVHLLHSDKTLDSPGHHPPGLHLMNKDFRYIQDFFPVEEDVDDLINKLDDFLDAE